MSGKPSVWRTIPWAGRQIEIPQEVYDAMQTAAVRVNGEPLPDAAAEMLLLDLLIGKGGA